MVVGAERDVATDQELLLVAFDVVVKRDVSQAVLGFQCLLFVHQSVEVATCASELALELDEVLWVERYGGIVNDGH